MSKLPALHARDVVKVAESVGFTFDRQRGSHAIYYRRSDKKRVVIPMHAGKDLKPGTLRGIITDLGLTPEEFAERLSPDFRTFARDPSLFHSNHGKSGQGLHHRLMSLCRHRIFLRLVHQQLSRADPRRRLGR